MNKTMVEIAKEYVGTVQGSKKHKEIIDGYNSIRPLPQGYKVKYSDSWCCAFVSFIESRCNLQNPIYECSCKRMLDLFKKAKQTVTKNKVAIGDIIFYDWKNNGTIDHIGIITDMSDTSYFVIEGNYSKQVKIRQIAKNSKEIEGFGRVTYKTDTGDNTDIIGKMAEDVIKGKYGTGAERKKLLGEYYIAVQKRVNEILEK